MYDYSFEKLPKEYIRIYLRAAYICTHKVHTRTHSTHTQAQNPVIFANIMLVQSGIIHAYMFCRLFMYILTCVYIYTYVSAKFE